MERLWCVCGCVNEEKDDCDEEIGDNDRFGRLDAVMVVTYEESGRVSADVVASWPSLRT